MAAEIVNIYKRGPRTIWHRLGFGRAAAPTMPDEDYPQMCPSRMISETEIYLDFVDRLRLLVSGRLHVVTSHKTTVAVRECISESAVSVLPGGNGNV